MTWQLPAPAKWRQAAELSVTLRSGAAWRDQFRLKWRDGERIDRSGRDGTALNRR